MTDATLGRSNHTDRPAGPAPHAPTAPSRWVTRWAPLLPAGASVLDLACGTGRHARWLAERGHRVTAVDRDTAALASLKGLAGVVQAIEADIENGAWPLPGRRFDAVVVTNYLWRPLWPTLMDSLAPGGLLLYETFSVEHAQIGKPSNPDFLLRPGELLERCSPLHVVAYENGFLTDPDRQVQRIAAIRQTQRDDSGHRLSASPPRHPL